MNLLKFDSEDNLKKYEIKGNLLGKSEGKKAIGNFYIKIFFFMGKNKSNSISNIRYFQHRMIYSNINFKNS